VGSALVLGALVPWSGPAWAGGGCHTGPTEGTGEVVELIEACYAPSNLQIQPGDTVTFVNRDSFVHNVGGNGWGHLEDMAPGDRFSATFDDAGIYPYACTYHPGMTGAIVVGEAAGTGDGTESVTAADVAAPQAPTEESGSWVWIAAGAVGVAVGLGGGLLLDRHRRSPDPV
jgi:plastocyanin